MKTVIFQPTPKNLRFIASELQAGKLVAIPTETVYGLAANALDKKACKKIFVAKKRPTTDPLIVHVESRYQAESYAHFNGLAVKLADEFWPGPLTLILPKKACIPGIVTAGGATVALRSPAHPIARRILALSGLPLAAPSANLFGYISPTEASHVADNMGGRVASIVDGGTCEHGLESTIVDLTTPSSPKILRAGSISPERLSRAIFPIRVTFGNQNEKRTGRQLAPGMLSRHYSPYTSLILFSGKFESVPPESAIIFLKKPTLKKIKAGRTYWLSQRGSLKDVARNLYKMLRLVDKIGVKSIYVETPSTSSGLAIAIKDRLTRAAAKR